MTSHNPTSICERLIALKLEHAAIDEDVGICFRLRGLECTTRACHKRGGWMTGPITLENATCFALELQNELTAAIVVINRLSQTIRDAADYFEQSSPDGDRMIAKMREAL